MIRVALVQMDSKDDLDDNLRKIQRFVRQAREGGADVVAFPEFMNFLPFSRSRIHFEREDGRTTTLLQMLARQHRILIHAGSLLIDSGGPRPFNQSFLVYPDGSIGGRYNKLHLYDGETPQGEPFRESELYTVGQEMTVVRALGTIVGTAICFDYRYPEPFRFMARAGAEIIFVPGNFSAYSGKHHLEMTLRTRAMENGVFIVSADQVGDKKKAPSWGHSMAIAPDGRMLGLKPEGEGLLFCDLDLELIRRQRRILPLLAIARDDVFRRYAQGLAIEPSPEDTAYLDLMSGK